MPRDQPQFQDAREYRRGALLVAGAALAWSTAGLLTRWTATDPWTTLFWRSIFAGAALLGYLVATERRDAVRAFTRLGLIGLLLGLCFAVSMITFITALSLTTVANVMVFQAASPIFAALLAWAWLKERIDVRIGLAIAATLAGITVMVSASGGVAAGGTALVGDLLGLAMSIASALTIILLRLDRRVSTTAAISVGMVLTGLLALPHADFAPSSGNLGILVLFGLGQMALPLVLFTSGVRLIPAADAGLISIVECVLAPLWVWLAFGETPDARGLTGGAIVLAAVAFAASRGRRPAPAP